MKKIIYVCLLALLGVSFGCEKDELTEENLGIDNKVELNSDFQKSANGADNYYDENGNPVETYYLYLDMDSIEANYTGSYTGSFSQHFYNEMSAHFTIHSVEYANSNCGNIERWVVTKQEYDVYVFFNGEISGNVIVVVMPNDDNGGNTSSTSNGDSGSSGDEGWGDENGNVTPKPTKKPDSNNPTQGAGNPYPDCF